MGSDLLLTISLDSIGDRGDLFVTFLTKAFRSSSNFYIFSLSTEYGHHKNELRRGRAEITTPRKAAICTHMEVRSNEPLLSKPPPTHLDSIFSLGPGSSQYHNPYHVAGVV